MNVECDGNYGENKEKRIIRGFEFLKYSQVKWLLSEFEDKRDNQYFHKKEQKRDVPGKLEFVGEERGDKIEGEAQDKKESEAFYEGDLFIRKNQSVKKKPRH